jgi:ParB-like nuclease domain
MKKHFANDMDVGLDCYDPENRVFPRIAEAKTPQLSKRDVLLILKWKLGRVKGSNYKTVSDDNMAKINQAIRKAGDSGQEIDALGALEEIPGIGLAVATAILTVCYPDKFSIIDKRVLEVLDLVPSTAKNKNKYSTEDWKAKEYFDKFLPKVKEWSMKWGTTLRDTDRALWGLSVNQDIEETIAIKEVPPETHLDRVNLRHKASDDKRLAKLRRSMKKGWDGRPLLVISDGDGYQVITGCHRGWVAMELRTPIPEVIIPESALDTQQRERLLSGDVPYDTLEGVFAERGLEKAAELMRQEMKLGIAEPVSPTVKRAASSKRQTIRRVTDV